MPDPLSSALAATIALTRDAERDLFGRLDDAARRRPIREGDWDPQDFQAHLTAWKARQADRYELLREGRPLPPSLAGPEEDALNAELRATRLDWSWGAIVEEADAVAARLIDEILTTGAETLRASDRLIQGTFGNGVLHALTHVRWLLEAGVPLDRHRVARFADEAEHAVADPAIPAGARSVGIYDVACFHALSGSADAARRLLRDAFQLDPELVAFSRTDPDLASIQGDIDDLAR